MTITEFLSLPEKPGRVCSLIAGRVFTRPRRRPDRQRRAAVERLLDLLKQDGGPELRTDFQVRHEPQDLFPVEIAVVQAGSELPALVVLIPRPGETIGETSDKVRACHAVGVLQVWELEFYSQQVTIHRPGDEPREYFRGDEALPLPRSLSAITPAGIFSGLPQPESALPDDVEKLWVDVLREKHECFGMSPAASVEVTVGGRIVQLIVPDHLVETEIFVTCEAGDLLFAIGREGHPWDHNEYLGVFIVAHQYDRDTYLAHVWHALYPNTLKYLGLDAETAAGNE